PAGRVYYGIHQSLVPDERSGAERADLVRLRSDGNVETLRPQNVDQFTVGDANLFERPLALALDMTRHQLVVLAAGTDPTVTDYGKAFNGSSEVSSPHPVFDGMPADSLFTYDLESNELTFLRVVGHPAVRFP